MTSTTPQDLGLLARAIALASQVAGATSPNPNVGCVIAVDGEVVGEGATAPAGGPHAEVVALQRAGGRARGATAYVTLEPCDHHGRTPPCTEALLRSGVRRVVIAHPEPHELAAGGIGRLRTGHVDVVPPGEPGELFRETVAAQLEGFLSLVERGRPHVTLKLAQTADGRLQAPRGKRWITGPIARQAVHRLRGVADAVLVGSGTVLQDDPRLDVRTVVSARQPRPVVFDGRLRTPPDAAVVGRGALIVTRSDAPVEERKALLDAGAEVTEVPGTGAHGLDLRAALELLGAHGIGAVLAEPGPTLARGLVGAGVVDRLILHIALGVGTGPPRRFLPAGDDLAGWRIERCGGAGPDLVVHLVPDPRPPDGALLQPTEGP